MYKIIGGDGREYGPVTVEQLKQWIAEGRASANTKVQALGRMDWQPLSAYPEFAEALGLPAAPPAPPPMRAPQLPAGNIPTYLVPAILTTIFCCLPFGIVAIVYSSQVNTKRIAGDVDGARASSRNAKLWCWLSFGFGLAAMMAWVVFYLVMIFGAMASVD
jgi:hypothetical protein